MKQNGVNVAPDFIRHLTTSGSRGGMVLVPCDDPPGPLQHQRGGRALIARLAGLPLLEPAVPPGGPGHDTLRLRLSEAMGYGGAALGHAAVSARDRPAASALIRRGAPS